MGLKSQGFSVLVLDEVICFLVADLVLCFGFSFSDSHAVLPARRLGGHKEMRGNETRAANLNYLKRYSIPYEIMWGKKPKQTNKQKL